MKEKKMTKKKKKKKKKKKRWWWRWRRRKRRRKEEEEEEEKQEEEKKKKKKRKEKKEEKEEEEKEKKKKNKREEERRRREKKKKKKKKWRSLLTKLTLVLKSVMILHLWNFFWWRSLRCGSDPQTASVCSVPRPPFMAENKYQSKIKSCQGLTWVPIKTASIAIQFRLTDSHRSRWL